MKTKKGNTRATKKKEALETLKLSEALELCKETKATLEDVFRIYSLGYKRGLRYGLNTK